MKDRIGLKDQDMLKDALEEAGFKRIRIKRYSVEALNEAGAFVCGFFWRSKSRGALPPGWEFRQTLLSVWCDADMINALRETKRVDLLKAAADDAWGEFLKSKSDKRWQVYRGYVAALLLGQSLDQDPKEDT